MRGNRKCRYGRNYQYMNVIKLLVTTGDQNLWWISDCRKTFDWYKIQHYNDNYINNENEDFQSLAVESKMLVIITATAPYPLITLSLFGYKFQ